MVDLARPAHSAPGLECSATLPGGPAPQVSGRLLRGPGTCAGLPVLGHVLRVGRVPVQSAPASEATVASGLGPGVSAGQVSVSVNPSPTPRIPQEMPQFTLLLLYGNLGSIFKHLEVHISAEWLEDSPWGPVSP